MPAPFESLAKVILKNKAKDTAITGAAKAAATFAGGEIGKRIGTHAAKKATNAELVALGKELKAGKEWAGKTFGKEVPEFAMFKRYTEAAKTNDIPGALNTVKDQMQYNALRRLEKGHAEQVAAHMSKYETPGKGLGMVAGYAVGEAVPEVVHRFKVKRLAKKLRTGAIVGGGTAAGGLILYNKKKGKEKKAHLSKEAATPFLPALGRTVAEGAGSLFGRMIGRGAETAAGRGAEAFAGQAFEGIAGKAAPYGAGNLQQRALERLGERAVGGKAGVQNMFEQSMRSTAKPIPTLNVPSIPTTAAPGARFPTVTPTGVGMELGAAPTSVYSRQGKITGVTPGGGIFANTQAGNIARDAARANKATATNVFYEGRQLQTLNAERAARAQQAAAEAISNRKALEAVGGQTVGGEMSFARRNLPTFAAAAETAGAAATSARQAIGRAIAPKGVVPTAEQLASRMNAPTNLVALERMRAGRETLGITAAEKAAREAGSLRARVGAQLAGAEKPVAAAIPTATKAETALAGQQTIAAREAAAAEKAAKTKAEQEAANTVAKNEVAATETAAETAANPVSKYIDELSTSLKEVNPKAHAFLKDYGPAISALAAPLVGMYGAKQATNMAMKEVMAKAAPWAAGGLAAGAGFGLLSRGGRD